MKEEMIKLSGSEKKVRFEIVSGALWLHVDGETYSFEPKRKKSSKAAAQSEPGVVRAPMPGKILKLMVSEGDAVEVGQEVVSMEAMKMEYVLKSDIAGKVVEVGCKEEDLVSLGQLLVKVEE